MPLSFFTAKCRSFANSASKSESSGPIPAQKKSAIVLFLVWLILNAITSSAQPTPSDTGTGLEIWIGLRTDGQPGSGTLADPFNGTGTDFDAKLGDLSYIHPVTNLVVHILPGLYQTRGSVVWSPLSGWRVHGSGIDITIVKLIGASNNVEGVITQNGSLYYANSEVSDLTVDCNYGPNNPNYAHAVTLNGSRHTIRRVKAINAYGVYPTFENFIIAISNYGFVSEGNLIENCEVSSFKGTYCTAIGLAGPGFISSLKQIQGIVRGNKVYDLINTSGPSGLIAYGGGGIRDSVFERNASYRCQTAVNIDSGKSRNVTFVGNVFLGCKYIGIGLSGQSLDNFVIEDNLIEMDSASRNFGIHCHDVGGRNKLTNFKIRNNTLRTVSGLASAGGGIAVSLISDGESFSVTGNRVEPWMRCYFSSPKIALFNNTDFNSKPIRTYDGFGGYQVNLPMGETGTLLLNRGSAYIISEMSSNPIANGTNLIVAYARARAMTPHGSPLSATNRATVFLLPGKYTLADSALVLDAQYVDLIGIGNAAATRLESDGNTLVQLANDIVIENLTLHCNSTAIPALGFQDKAAYFPDSNLPKTVLRNCTFSAGNNGFGMRLGIIYSGVYEKCVCGPRGWGGSGTFSGVAVNCASGDFSFGSVGGIFTGFATNCLAGMSSFGAGGFHGIAKNCVAGHDSFGGSGFMLSCEVAGAINSLTPTTGKLRDCRIGPAPGNFSTLFLGTGATLHNCTVIANPAGSGFSIDAVAMVHAKIAHCRFNHSLRNVINDILQPFNVDDPSVD